MGLAWSGSQLDGQQAVAPMARPPRGHTLNGRFVLKWYRLDIKLVRKSIQHLIRIGRARVSLSQCMSYQVNVRPTLNQCVVAIIWPTRFPNNPMSRQISRLNLTLATPWQLCPDVLEANLCGCLAPLPSLPGPGRGSGHALSKIVSFCRLRLGSGVELDGRPWRGHLVAV